MTATRVVLASRVATWKDVKRAFSSSLGPKRPPTYVERALVRLRGVYSLRALVRGLLLGVIRCPEGQVVTEQLHDEGGVLVRLLVEGVELRDGVVEGLVNAGGGRGQYCIAWQEYLGVGRSVCFPRVYSRGEARTCLASVQASSCLACTWRQRGSGGG